MAPVADPPTTLAATRTDVADNPGRLAAAAMVANPGRLVTTERLHLVGPPVHPAGKERLPRHALAGLCLLPRLLPRPSRPVCRGRGERLHDLVSQQGGQHGLHGGGEALGLLPRALPHVERTRGLRHGEDQLGLAKLPRHAPLAPPFGRTCPAH